MDMMEAQWTFLVTACFLGGDVVTSQSDDITVYFQVNPPNNIQEGITEQMIFTCQVTGSFVDGSDRLTISKKRPDEMLDLLVSTTGKYTNAPNNVYFNGWSGGVLTMSVRALNRSDSGEYNCQIQRLVGGSYYTLDFKTLAIDILFPASGEPFCETLPANPDFAWNNGSQITAKCTSDAGNPTVILQWFLENNVPLPGAQLQMSSDKVISTIPVTLDYSFNGLYLICTRLHQAFEANNVFCRLGPFIIQESTDTPAMTTTGSPLIPMTSLVTTVAGEPTTMPSKSETNAAIVAAIVIVTLVITLLIIIILICLVRSGRCKPLIKTKNSNTNKDNIPLEITPVNGKVTTDDNSHDSPVPVKHIISPVGGEVYAVVQKKHSQGAIVSSADSSNQYPAPPSYPRPPKSRESTEGEQYANTATILNTPEDSTVQTEIKDETRSSKIPEEGTLAAQEKENSGQSENNLYSNTSDIAGVCHPSVSAEPMQTDHQAEETLYANTSDLHLPAPSESPPAPPDESSHHQPMSHTPGLEYADLDLARPASLGTAHNDIKPNSDSVVYAAVRS